MTISRSAGPPRALMVLSENWTLRPTPSLNDLVDLAVEAEQLGVDGVMISDHVALGPSSGSKGLPLNLRDYAMPGNQDPSTPWPSPYVLLAAIASRTTTLRLVLGAIISPLRHPLISAKDLGTLDLLSNGRLVVLPTVSWHEDEYRALGVPFRERGAILDEQLAIWRDVWTNSPSSFHGAHYSFDDIYIEPKALRPGGPTLWFGGSTLHDAVIRRLVRYGSGFNPLGRPTPLEMAKLEETLRNHGRLLSDLELVGGIRGEFLAPDAIANLSSAIAGAAGQVRDGFSTLCFKPSMFTDDLHGVGEVCSRLLAGISNLN